MSLFDRDQFQNDKDEPGVTLDDLGIALITWAAMRLEGCTSVSVADAAVAFNTTPDMIREAVERVMWICIDNPQTSDPFRQILELEGE